MIDYEQIGKRINEERKYLRRISQEKMAEDLGMYQADISNLEKAKSGSGITDLSKLDMIADYFDIPLEKLLFGQEEINMIKYYGKEMEIRYKGTDEKIPKAHRERLSILIGEQFSNATIKMFSCGPYSVYVGTEYQHELTSVDGSTQERVLPKSHIYCFMQDDIIGTMTMASANVMAIINQQLLAGLCSMIERHVLDPTDVCRTINPYWAIVQFADSEDERKEAFEKMIARMDELKKEADTIVLFIESAYVRDGYRKNGIMRMMLDVAEMMAEEPIIWLNLEPTAGYELEEEYTYYPEYINAAIGQLNENAAIAEKLGFTIDPDVWHKRVYVGNEEDDDKDLEYEVIEMRKCAFKIPNNIKKIIRNDGNLVAIGRAKQAVQQLEKLNIGFEL